MDKKKGHKIEGIKKASNEGRIGDEDGRGNGFDA